MKQKLNLLWHWKYVYQIIFIWYFVDNVKWNSLSSIFKSSSSLQAQKKLPTHDNKLWRWVYHFWCRRNKVDVYVAVDCRHESYVVGRVKYICLLSTFCPHQMVNRCHVKWVWSIGQKYYFCRIRISSIIIRYDSSFLCYKRNVVTKNLFIIIWVWYKVCNFLVIFLK